MTQATRTSMWSALPTPPDSWNTIPGKFAVDTTYLNHAAVLLHNGRVLVAGGSGLPGDPNRQRVPNQGTRSTQIFDPNSNTWSKAADLNVVRYSDPTGTLLLNERVLLIGNNQQAEIYEPNADTWTSTTSMNAAHANHTATLLPNGKVLVAGGGASGGQAPVAGGSVIVTMSELFDPNAGTWTATNPMTAARANHTATLLPNGQVLVAGGDTTGPTAELFDPATGNWTSTGPMAAIRVHHTATLLSNGYVLVAGGGDPGKEIATTELYLPISNTWVSVSSMNIPRTNHTATLLYDNRVLIVGGSGSLMTFTTGDNDIMRTVPGDTMLLTPDGKTISTTYPPITNPDGTKTSFSYPNKPVYAGQSEECYTPSQYQGPQADFAALNGTVKQLSNTISSLSQTLNKTQQNVRWGYINADGTIIAGSGNFTVALEPTVKIAYDITFQPPFSSTPSIVAQGVATQTPGYIPPAWAIMATTVVYVDKNRCRVQAVVPTYPTPTTTPNALPLMFIATGS